MTTAIEASSVAMIREFLATIDRARQEICQSVNGPPLGDWRRRTMERLVLDVGRPYVGHVLSGRYRAGIPRHCYENVWRLVRRSTRLRYVEGFALSEHGILPVFHAWAVREEDDKVIDPTWENPADAAYLGIEIPHETVAAMIEATGSYSCLGSDYAAGHPFRRLGRVPTPVEIWRAKRGDLDRAMLDA